MRSQWPVRTQMRTSMTDRENDSNSAAVKRPQQPKEILENTQHVLDNKLYSIIKLSFGSSLSEFVMARLK